MPAVPIHLPPPPLPIESPFPPEPRNPSSHCVTPTSLGCATPYAACKPRDSGLLTRRIDDSGTGIPRPLYASLGDFFAEAGVQDFTRDGTLLVLARHGTSVFNRLHDVFYDSLDSPLTLEGRDSARNLGRILNRYPVRTVYASPIERAYEFAVLADAELASERGVVVLDDLAEISLGLLDAYPCRMDAATYDVFLERMLNPTERTTFARSHGLTLSEINMAFSRALVRRRFVRDYCAAMGTNEDAAVKAAALGLPALGYRAPLGGTSFEDIRAQSARVRGLLASSESSPGAIVLCSHGMINRVLLLEFLGLELVSREQLSLIRQDNGCANVLWRENGSDKWRLFVLNGSVAESVSPLR